MLEICIEYMILQAVGPLNPLTWRVVFRLDSEWRWTTKDSEMEESVEVRMKCKIDTAKFHAGLYNVLLRSHV